MHPGTLKYYNTGEDLNGLELSSATFQDNYYYSDQSQDFDHTLEDDLYTIDEMTTEEEAEQRYAQHMENESSGLQKLTESVNEVDWIDQSLQQISDVRSGLMDQHDFNRAKRVELDAISSELKHARSLIPSLEPKSRLEDKTDEMAKDKSNRITATPQDKKQLGDSRGPASVLPRLLDAKVGLLNQPPSNTPVRSNPTSLCKSYTAQSTSQFPFPTFSSIRNPSRSSLALSTPHSEEHSSETNHDASPLAFPQQKDAGGNWPHETYACSSDTSAGCDNRMSSDTMSTLLSKDDLSDSQHFPSLDLSLHSTADDVTEEEVLDPGWAADTFEDIISQLGPDERIPSATWSRPSRSHWLQSKASQLKYRQLKKPQYDHSTSLKLRLARLC